MDLLDILAHLAAFSLPALGIALLLPPATRVFMRKRPASRSYIAQAAIVFVASWLVLAAGAWGFGQDGRVATYAAMAAAAGVAQWVLLRGWR